MKTLTTMLILVGVAAPAHAVDVVVFPPNVVNLEAGEGTAIGEVLAGAFTSVTRNSKTGDAAGATVMGPSESAEALAAAGGSSKDARAAAAAKVLGAERYVMLTAVRLKRKITLRGRLVWSDGSKSNSAEIVAGGLDDMEAAADRMARALLSGKTTAETRTHRSVTRREARRRNRTFSERITGVRTGIIKPLAGGASFDTQATLHFDLRLEGETYFIEFGAGLTLPTGDDGSEGYGGIFARGGGAVYLTDGEAGVYVGGGVEPRLQSGGDSIVGFAPYANLGVMFMRSSSARIYMDLQVAQNLLAIDTTLDFDEEQGDEFFPTEVGVMLGIGW